MNGVRWVCGAMVGVGLIGGAVACSSDPVVQPGVDAGPDVTVTDTGTDSPIVKDGGADAAAEAAPPCPDASAGVAVGGGSNGVQCDSDGGALFCAKSLSVCCSGANGLKCNSKAAGCGANATTFECDKPSDCTDGGVCCIKNFKAVQGCPTELTTTQGTYCATACTGSDIKTCNGDQTACFNSKCTTLHVQDAPGKALSGCL